MHPLANLEPQARTGLDERALVPTVTRRRFMAATGLVVAFHWIPGRARAAAPAVGAADATLAPNAYVRIGTDNLVTVVCKHFEMGEGSTTGLATLIADELDADWNLVRTEYAPADNALYGNGALGGMQGTGGSTAIANSFVQYRTAGATARAMLVAAAADAWQVPASEITTSQSTLSHRSGKRATYGEMAVAASKQRAPDKPALKTKERFVYIGKDRATPRVDSPSKCDGTATYAADVKLPGLLAAVIAWPPSFGAKVVSFDATDAKKVKGVTDVVQVPEGVAVVATNTWAALQGRRALNVQWDESVGAGLDSDALLARYKAQATETGKAFTKPASGTTASTTATRTIEAVYEFPFLAHAPMEPMTCVAWLHDGRLETWAGHQFPAFDHPAAAEAAGLPKEKVELHTLVAGGSFGRRANAWSDFTVAAVHVAKAIGGRAPVRLQYMREDDTGAGLYRPMFVHRASIGLDGRGRIASWKHAIVGQSLLAGTPLEAMMKDGIDETMTEGIHPTAYPLPMLDGTVHAPSLPIRPLWWRSVGNTHTAFVMETLMDELAAAAGQDAVAYRLALLESGDEKGRRAAGALKLAASRAGWGKPLARGLAQGAAVHFSFESYVAQIAEVSMVDGKVKVHRVVCAVDCGTVVNPDVVRAQMEGCIGFALGALYYGEIEVRNGRAQQRNFDTYRSLRIHEMPKVEVYMVDSDEAPTGVGEPGVPPLAPAVVNAIARLGGPRIRRLPLTRAGLVAT